VQGFLRGKLLCPADCGGIARGLGFRHAWIANSCLPPLYRLALADMGSRWGWVEMPAGGLVIADHQAGPAQKIHGYQPHARDYS